MPTKLIRTKMFADDRGWFTESYNRSKYADLGISLDFCQDNHSMSRQPGVLRGLHFQRPPHAQAKLIRCLRGRIWDVAVDIRLKSPTYAKWVAAELDAESGLQMFVPIGFAHGFLTLEPDTEVQYKVSDYYAPEFEGGIVWDDPTLDLPWPLRDTVKTVSERDQQLPRLAEFKSPFFYDGIPLSAPGIHNLR